MMHTHGDVAGPLPESVLLVGTILRDQMNMLLIKTTEASPSIKGKLTHENILLVLRENKAKLKRLLFYLKLRDMKDCFYKKKPLMEEEEEKNTDVDNIAASASHMLTKLVDRPEYGRRVRTCLEFLRKIDKSFDWVSIVDSSVKDPITINRLKRRYLITLNMSDAEYLEYARKLQASFYPKGGGKLFSKWLLVDNVTHLVPDELALEMINFIAYETVAEIVDMSLQLQYNRNTTKHTKENKNESTSHSNSTIINKGTLTKGHSTSKHSLNVMQETGNATTNLLTEEDCSFLQGNLDMARHESAVNEECVMSLNESMMPNIFDKSDYNINTQDIESLSKCFGDEFKEGVKKEPITPDIIREALDICSGNHKHGYNVQWMRAKEYNLLCTQDIYTISLQI